MSNYNKKSRKPLTKSMKGGESETVVVSNNSKYANIEPVMLKPLEVVVYNNGFDTLVTIRKMLGRVTVEETVEETNSVDLVDWIKLASKEDIVDKILEWNKENPDFAFLKFKGPYLYFENTKLTKDNTAKGREGAKEYLLESEKTFEDVFNIWKKYVL